MTVAQATLYGALVGAGATLATGIAAIGSLVIERRRDRREARQRSDAAVAEMVTATTDLLSGCR